MGIKKNITTMVLAGTVLMMTSSFTSSAAGLSAGITAALGERLAVHASAYKSAGTLPFTGTAEQPDSTEDTTAGNTAAEDHTICGYTNLGIADVQNHLNIREAPGTDQKLVGKLPKNGGCEILETVGEWYKIQSGKVTGYVSAEYVLTGEAAAARAAEVKSTVAVTNTMTVYVRMEPNTECTILTAMPEGEEISVIEDQGEWIKVELDNDEGYIYSKYVDISEQLPKAMSMSEIQYGDGVSNVRADLVNYACKFVGNPYVWGGTSLTGGVDCSGFTMKIYAKYGISLPHNASAQSAYGTSIKSSQARPGDLFFYSKGGKINHVAIYIGNGQVVHASSPKSGIKISNAYYRTPCKVVRLID